MRSFGEDQRSVHRHEALKLLEPIQHDVDLQGGLGPLDLFQHQKTLAIGRRGVGESLAVMVSMAIFATPAHYIGLVYFRE